VILWAVSSRREHRRQHEETLEASRAGDTTTKQVDVTGEGDIAMIRYPYGEPEQASSKSVADRLEELDALLEGGAISEDEYTPKPQSIIDAL
jgi:hypothetical protein